jgi:hypothetical protein
MAITVSLYSNLSLDDLVTYSIFTLFEEHKEATFENIVAKCYDLFPERFALVGYPQWPDSARVNKSWLRCRTDFKYIKGSVKTGFVITAKGLEVVAKVQHRLKRPSYDGAVMSRKRKQASERTREEKFINELEKADVFKRYMNEKGNIDISHFEFVDMLYCTLESSWKSLKDNIEKLKLYAQKLERKEVLDFLEFAESKFSRLLQPQKTEKEEREFLGGMNKKKL